MYYKLIFTYETENENYSFATCVQVFPSGNLNETIQDIVKDNNIPSDYTVKIEKTTLKKLAEEEQMRVLDELEDGYLTLKHGAEVIHSTDYTKLKFKQRKDYCAACNLYADLRKYLCACRTVRQTVDTTKTTVDEFDKMVLELLNINGKYIN